MEHAAESSEQQAARRLRTGARVLLALLALALTALLWHRHQSPPAKNYDADVVHWTGITNEGQSIEVTTNGLLLTHFDTTVLERCTEGPDFTFRWLPVLARFVQNGRTVTAARTYSGFDDALRAPYVARMRFEGYVGARVAGTVYGEATLTMAGRTVRCDSGPVTFVVNRSRA